MKVIKKLTLFLLTALLLCSVAGCNGDTTWVYEWNGEKLPAGIYIFNMLNAYGEVENDVYLANAQTNPTFSYQAIPQKDVLASEKDGMNAAAWITQKAKNACLEYYAVERQYADLGLQMDPLWTKEMEEGVRSALEQSGTLYQDNGIAESSLVLFYTNQQKRQALFENTYGPEGSLPVPDEELMAYFTQKYAKASYLPFTKAQGDDEAAVAQNNETKDLVEGYLKLLQEGEEIEDVIFSHELYEATAEQKPTITKPEKDSRSILVTEEYALYYGEELVNGIFATEIGQPALIETEDSWYLIVRLDLSKSETDFAGYRESLLYELKTDEFNAALLEYAGTLGILPNDKAFSRYTADKLKTQ